jgi:hypothetical protein
MKKNEDAAAKKKPKTSAAQIRVQKGYVLLRLFEMTTEYPTALHRLDGAGFTINHEDSFRRSRRSTQLHTYYHT